MSYSGLLYQPSKLRTRVRFPSPAHRQKAPFNGAFFVIIVSLKGFHAVVILYICVRITNVVKLYSTVILKRAVIKSLILAVGVASNWRSERQLYKKLAII